MNRSLHAALVPCALLGALAVVLVACGQPRGFDDASTDHAAPPDAAAPGLPGGPCALNAEGEPVGGCASDQFCLSPREGYPGGYCANDCRTAPCPMGSQCLPSADSRHFCARSCRTDADCRASEGYACRPPRVGAQPACLPNNTPVGHRPDGSACFTAASGDAGAGGGHYLAPLPAVTFTAPALSVSRTHTTTTAEAEAGLALDPSARGGALASFVGLSSDGYWSGGLMRIANDGSLGTTTVVRDHEFDNVFPMVAAFDRSARLHVLYNAIIGDRPYRPISYSASDDGGATVPSGLPALPMTECTNGCTAPALAVGQDVGGAADVVYAAGIASRPTGNDDVLFARAPAATGMFAAPVTLGTLEATTNGVRRNPTSLNVGVGPDAGTVAVVWVATNLDDGLGALGDKLNGVRVRVSHDGGASFDPVREVTRAGDAPVAQVPFVGMGGGALHVVYVTGGLLGAWDVVLATSTDGGASFGYRVVNDDPESCATHAFVGFAVDGVTGEAHVVWLENRFGNGTVAYARCPADASQRCGRNEQVSGTPFVFTTSTDALRWHGTRSALALGADGSVWAGWSDTRTGGPGVYVARGQR